MNSASLILRRSRLAGLALAALALCAAPAWSACVAPKVNGRTVQAFRADDGVVHALATGLTWQRCSLGQHFDGGKCLGTAAKLDWPGAQKAAAAAGQGWRLPTQPELASLVLSYCGSPATDAVAFPQLPAAWFWSSAADGAQGAWFVDFEGGGGNGATLRSNTAAVRLVRSGK
jgi:hypothetical protein